MNYAPYIVPVNSFQLNIFLVLAYGVVGRRDLTFLETYKYLAFAP